MKLVFWGNLGSRRISGAALPQCQALTDRFLAKLKEKDIYSNQMLKDKDRGAS